jgi:hypothetical protein
LAANGGDVATLCVLFAVDARFDRAGAVFTGRDQILDGFLKPDVIDPNGRYHETARAEAYSRILPPRRSPTTSATRGCTALRRSESATTGTNRRSPGGVGLMASSGEWSGQAARCASRD